jgi:hypothetical protein
MRNFSHELERISHSCGLGAVVDKDVCLSSSFSVLAETRELSCDLRIHLTSSFNDYISTTNAPSPGDGRTKVEA